IAVTEMLSGFTRVHGLEVQSGKTLHTADLGQISIVLSLATLPLGYVASKKYGDRVQLRAGQLTYPVIGMIRPSHTDDLCPRSHGLSELFSSSSKRRHVQ